MKKLLLVSTAILISLFSMSGCSPAANSTDNTDVIEAVSDIESYKGETELYFTAHADGKEIAMGTTGKINLKSEPFFADIDLSISSKQDEADEVTWWRAIPVHVEEYFSESTCRDL